MNSETSARAPHQNIFLIKNLRVIYLEVSAPFLTGLSRNKIPVLKYLSGLLSQLAILFLAQKNSIFD